ncbi:MAG TPA: phosphoglycerate mutase family protein [Flavobacterium sp.]|jgi:broad specificity phosphatase PhoE
MKIYILAILTSVLSSYGCSSDDEPQPVQPVQQQPVQTVIYLIRHAEKADASPNPDLSAVGLQRANNWATILQDVQFDAFYSTNYNRTRQTIQPTATTNEKEVLLYDPASFSLDDVIVGHNGKNVFIVGHSNTIPQLINTYLGANIYPDMSETEFGNLYKITIVDGVVSHNMIVYN